MGETQVCSIPRMDGGGMAQQPAPGLRSWPEEVGSCLGEPPVPAGLGVSVLWHPFPKGRPHGDPDTISLAVSLPLPFPVREKRLGTTGQGGPADHAKAPG